MKSLNGLALPGAALLVELVEYIQQNPQTTCGGLLEHWRDTDNGRHLVKLISMPSSTPEEGVEAEFEGAIRQLAIQRTEQRVDELLEKMARTTLTEEEKLEFSELNQVLAGK